MYAIDETVDVSHDHGQSIVLSRTATAVILRPATPSANTRRPRRRGAAIRHFLLRNILVGTCHTDGGALSRPRKQGPTATST